MLHFCYQFLPFVLLSMFLLTLYLYNFFQFDIVLGSKWESALENGCFWYTLDEVRRRKIDGKFGFIAQVSYCDFQVQHHGCH